MSQLQIVQQVEARESCIGYAKKMRCPIVNVYFLKKRMGQDARS